MRTLSEWEILRITGGDSVYMNSSGYYLQLVGQSGKSIYQGLLDEARTQMLEQWKLSLGSR
ncbi:hypothetical protein [Burkholderia gladioli]|uniref:hypothetical protein n=1 Tax=Burkholderia gladioli TaxID=28095 RepID=UPI003F79AFA1